MNAELFPTDGTDVHGFLSHADCADSRGIFFVSHRIHRPTQKRTRVACACHPDGSKGEATCFLWIL